VRGKKRIAVLDSQIVKTCSRNYFDMLINKTFNPLFNIRHKNIEFTGQLPTLNHMPLGWEGNTASARHSLHCFMCSQLY